MAACTSCGSEEKSLLEIFPGEAVGQKLPFCADCVSLGACELPFVKDRDLGPRDLLQRVVRVNRNVLDELHRVRAHADSLETRLAALEDALVIEREL